MCGPGPVPDALVAALPELHTWTLRPSEEKLGDLPNKPAVLLFIDEQQRPVQLLTTQQLKRFAWSRLSEPDEARRGRADLAAVVRGLRYRLVHCPFEARWRYWQLARRLHPDEYRKMIGFGRAWFLHIDLNDDLPEPRVTERVWERPGSFVGPWPTHKACNEALDGLRDLFELCRYPEQVRKAPHGTRCAYAEMGRCDAPCDGSASLAAYHARCAAAWRFASGAVQPWLDDAERRMRDAAAALQFELAGQIKQQRAFVDRWQKQWRGVVAPADEMRYFLAIPIARRQASKLFVFRTGSLYDGPVIQHRHLAERGPAWVTDVMGPPPPPCSPEERMEQTWLLSHFLFNREARASCVVRLPAAPGVAALKEEVRQQAETLQWGVRVAQSAPAREDAQASPREDDAPA